jgi:hypothetical protein
MDSELSRIASEFLQPGEQLLWAGRPERGSLISLSRQTLVFCVILALVAILTAVSAGASDLATIARSVVPMVFLLAMVVALNSAVRRRMANPAKNACFLTNARAVHVFQEQALIQSTCIALDGGTSVKLSRSRGETGDLLFRRNLMRQDNPARRQRRAWAGVRMQAIPHAAYVRDIALWAIAQQEHQLAQSSHPQFWQTRHDSAA